MFAKLKFLDEAEDEAAELLPMIADEELLMRKLAEWPLGGATIEDEPEPVEAVSAEMDEPEEKGGKERSEGDGDEGKCPEADSSRKV